ncbi:MAG: cAMP-binding protein [Rhodospirillaceae bacterium]|nr:MAG: cAMP-binding protein [Rhodospirillaceae bacterium]
MQEQDKDKDKGTLERCVLTRGAKVFAQGDPGDAAYVVESGRVAIYKHINDKKVHLATLVKGALFGEMAVLDGSPRIAAAVALEDTILVRIPGNVVSQKMSRSDPFIKALVMMLIENLRNVHKVYVARPRSLEDFVKVLAETADVLHRYTNVVDMDTYSAEVAKRLDTLQTIIEELKVFAARHPDRRLSAFPDASQLPD